MTPTERPDPREWATRQFEITIIKGDPRAKYPKKDEYTLRWNRYPIVCCTAGDPLKATKDDLIMAEEKRLRELMAACYRHAAAVAREEIRHADTLHVGLGRLGGHDYPKGVTDGRKDFAGKIAEALERLAASLEGE